MLSLQNFDQQITGAILERGRDYYKEGHVVNLEQTSDNTWAADVEGSETYEVEVTLKNDNEIEESSCDCPYDGTICKHQVAVFFVLRDEIKAKPKQKEKKTAAKNLFDKLLAATSADELKEFVKAHAAKDRKFKTEFELYFADKDDRVDIEGKYNTLIQKIIRSHSDHGYIEYRSSHSLAREVNKLLHTGNDYLAKSNYREAFTLARVVLRQMMETITQADDSSGAISDIIYSATELLQNIVNTAPIALQEQVFDFLQKELTSEIYFDYGDFGYNLFAVYQRLSITLRRDKDFISFVDTASASLKSDYENYRKNFFQTKKIEFLQQTGQAAAAERLVQQSIDIVEVRQGEVEKTIKAKKYEKAKSLIVDGIRLAEKKEHLGTVSRWKEYLLHIAELEKDIPAIRELTMQFAFNRGFSAEYYRRWKKTFSVEEWQQVIEAHIAAVIRRTKQEKRVSNDPKYTAQTLLNLLGPIFIEEKYFDRLLPLVQQADQLNTTLQYHFLKKIFPSEMMALYLPQLEAYGLQVSDRNGYADLVKKMQLVMKDIPQGKEDVLALARRLREKFSVKPRRPPGYAGRTG